MNIPERTLEMFGDHVGFRAESIIPGQGQCVYIWFSNNVDTHENFLSLQNKLLRGKGIEARMGPGIDFGKSALYKRPVVDLPPKGEEGFGVYLEKTSEILYTKHMRPEGEPFTGDYVAGP